MPINIYIADSYKTIDYLCENIWNLPDQIHALEIWLKTKGVLLPEGSYVADIGFDIRKNATGGGAVLGSDSMKIMSGIGMDIYFSEYPEASK